MITLAMIQSKKDELDAAQARISACFARDEDGEYNHPLLVLHRLYMTREYKRLHPRRKFIWVKAREAFPETEARWQTVGKWYMRKLIRHRDRLQEELANLCAMSAVPVAEEWTRIYTIDGGTFMSQGYGADSYARNCAERRMEHAADYGIVAEVRVGRVSEGTTAPFGKWGGHYYKYTTFEVWARTTELGSLILEHKPEGTLRDFVKGCWKKGINPRVLNPWIPAGYEEANGLNYFGGEA